MPVFLSELLHHAGAIVPKYIIAPVNIDYGLWQANHKPTTTTLSCYWSLQPLLSRPFLTKQLVWDPATVRRSGAEWSLPVFWCPHALCLVYYISFWPSVLLAVWGWIKAPQGRLRNGRLHFTLSEPFAHPLNSCLCYQTSLISLLLQTGAASCELCSPMLTRLIFQCPCWLLEIWTAGRIAESSGSGEEPWIDGTALLLCANGTSLGTKLSPGNALWRLLSNSKGQCSHTE